LTPQQLEWWIDYAQVAPFGPLREDLRAAMIVCSMRGGHPREVFDSLAGPVDPRAAWMVSVANAGGKLELRDDG